MIEIIFLKNQLNIKSGPAVHLNYLVQELQQNKNFDLQVSIVEVKNLLNYIHGKHNNKLILHLNTIPIKGIWTLLLPIKKVITLHGDLPFTEPLYTPYKRRIFEKNFLKIYSKLGFYSKVDLFFSVSNNLRKNLSKHLNIPLSRIETVYNGVDLKIFSPDIRTYDFDLLDKFDLKSKKYVLHVNNYAPKKNPKTLIEIFEILSNKYNNLKFVIIGKGWDHVIKNSKLYQNKRLIYISFLDHKMLSSFYRHAVAFINPTIHETFGMTNLEAIACGCPVITTRRYAIPEILGNAALYANNPFDSQLFVEKFDIILKDPILGKKYIERAKSFTWSKVAENVYNGYIRVINEKK
jgi:glycosyltransferase involved in cell wall biosynthesis